MEYIFTVISAVFMALLITVFVFSCKQKIDVTGKLFYPLLMLAMPLAVGLSLIDISIITNEYNGIFRIMESISIIVFSVLIFARMNSSKRRYGYPQVNEFSKLKQKLICGIIYFIVYIGAIYLAFVLVYNRIEKDGVLDNMLNSMNKFPILYIFFIFFMLVYLIYVVTVFMSFAGIFLLGIMGLVFSFIILMSSNIRSLNIMSKNIALKLLVIFLSIIPGLNIIIGFIMLIRLQIIDSQMNNNNTLPCMQ